MHKAFWILDHDKNKDFRFQHVTEDPFKNWEQSRSPDMKAEMQLDMALRCLYADEKDLGQQYLRRAIAVAERALNEDKCRSERARGDYPVNEGLVLRALAYARALSGEQLNTTLLSSAAERIVRYSEEIPKRDWDEVVQSLHLAAVRLALLAGDRVGASTVLRSKKRKLSKGNLEEEGLFDRLAVASQPEELRSLEATFRSFFDRVRDPHYRHPDTNEPVLHRFDLGALYNKYFVRGGGEVDWSRVIETVSE